MAVRAEVWSGPARSASRSRPRRSTDNSLSALVAEPTNGAFVRDDDCFAVERVLEVAMQG